MITPEANASDQSRLDELVAAIIVVLGHRALDIARRQAEEARLTAPDIADRWNVIADAIEAAHS